MAAYLQCKLPLLRFPHRRVHTDDHAVGRLALHKIVLADDKRHQVGGHDGCSGELHFYETVILWVRLPIDHVLQGTITITTIGTTACKALKEILYRLYVRNSSRKPEVFYLPAMSACIFPPLTAVISRLSETRSALPLRSHPCTKQNYITQCRNVRSGFTSIPETNHFKYHLYLCCLRNHFKGLE